MIEAGIAAIAICLPPLRGLIVKESLGSMVASVRSVISLSSLRPASKEETRTDPYTSIHGTGSRTTQTTIIKEERPSLPQLPDTIHVEKNFSQSDSVV